MIKYRDITVRLRTPPGYTCEEVPPDLALCNRCRKTVGDCGGRYGEECECK